ncbi:MAG: hypothetical protein M1818_002690 [Claussenomyces sp. TS43310]|nr:MAG: hypothetical protein M1818_002690 [Claussenomyces sp. TS43310]
MSGSQYTKCVQAICMTMKQLAALEFPAYGSLYFANAPFDSALKKEFSKGFCIGPHCGTAYWDLDGQGIVRPSAPAWGPWSDLAAYASGLIDNGYSRLPPPSTEISRPSYFGALEEHRNLLRSGREVIQSLVLQSQIREAAAPTLLHADLNARNIYVANDDPTKVTCLIDWQSSSIEPAFIYANELPDFATPASHPSPGETEDETCDRSASMTEQDKKLEKVALYCYQAYDICTKAFIPRMRVARALDQVLVRPFQYCHTSWRDSAPAFRQELLDLADQWEGLGLTGCCPYKPSSEELELHRKEYTSFKHVQELKLTLIQLLNTDSDGWVPIDRWEEVRRAHKEVFDLALETARNGDDDTEDDPLSEEDVRELWPFDDQTFN